MKIDALSVQYPNYSSTISATKKSRKGDVPTTETGSPQPTGFTTISFKGGNKDDVLHVVAECRPFNQKGGVATVVDDYKRLNNASASNKGKTVFITPFYNGIVSYDKDGIRKGVSLPKVPDNIPDGHPLKGLEGKYIYVKNNLSKQSLLDATKSGDFWVLEEVAEKTMTWGSEEAAPMKLLRVVADKKGEALKDKIYMVFSEATAYDPEPYSAGQYSSAKKVVENSWLGDPYPKFDKAAVEFMEEISKHEAGFDPGTVVCSDSQAAYVTHFMAKKNADGVEYFKGKKPIQIGHNLADGYIGMTSARNMMINLDVYSPEELKQIMNSPEYIKALQEGSEAEEKYIIEHLKVFEKMTPENKLSAISVAEHYGNTGYLPKFGVVSQGYLDEIVVNPEITQYLHKDMKALKDKGVAVGFTNPLNDGESAFKDVNMQSYRFEIPVTLADGKKEVIKPMLHFEEKDRATLTLKQLKEYKRQNKINFLERFLPKYDGASAINGKDQKTIIDKGADYIRAGATGKDITVVQNIDPKYIEKLKKGEDVNVIVSWGRGDFQKALDEVLTGYKKYVNKTGDKNSILILGGDLTVDRAEGKNVKAISEVLSKDEVFRGRVMLIDGFAPGRPMARMADTVILPSRFAPCELTDLEAKSELCTPIVPNGQGMKQKNFDPDITGEADMADAYKMKHQYYDSREEMLKSANNEDKESFNKVYNKVKKGIEDKYKIKMEKEISPELLEEELLKDEDYSVALRNLRDNVMSDEIAENLERRFKHTDDATAEKIMKNQINMLTGWENNQKITRSTRPTGELYREAFHLDATNVNKADVIGSNVDKSGLANITETGRKGSFWKSKGGKWAIAGIAVLAVAGGIIAILKGKGNKVASPAISAEELTRATDEAETVVEKVAEEVVGENLSAVV